ncbi:MAG: fasciclin domain-containing protein [Bacteroidota bacterium]|nr:fasciclin domain-containing protein [Bacteroidota bacterium]
MKINSLKIFVLIASMGMSSAWAQCEADATVYLTDFLFTPNEFTISVGETVAFVNAEGTHNVDGTAEDNPVSFFLEETVGNIDGVCMGSVTFDVPGVYTFTSSIGVQPELGMTGTIIVDAETLCDVMLSFWGSGENQDMDAYASAYAFQSYFGCSFFGQSGGFPGSNVSLEGLDEYTLFLPYGPAIEGLQELMNLNSFDLLYFTEGMVAGLSYHIVPGVYLAEDLQDGALLPTVEGQNIAVSVDGEGTVMLNGATVLHEDIEAFNGVIHVIDEVLVPSGYPGATTWDVIVQSPEHTVLEEALLAENLDQALRGQPILNDNEPAEGPFTVFAPTDDAFFALAEANGFESVDALLSSQFIDDILHAHIVPGVYESVDLFNGMNLSSYNNSGTVNITVDDDGIQANTAPVIGADMLAYNGVVHSLGEVMPFDFPAPEGTCGAWTITMTCGNGGPSGWDGASLHVLVDGNEVASETMLNIGSESFFIPGDICDRLDVVYNEDGWGQYHDYSIADSDGNVVFSSDDWGAPGDDPCSVYGLEPCEDMSSCGLMEVTFFDGDGYGWYAGGMAFYSDEGLESQIFFNPDFDGDGYFDYDGFSSRTAMVTVWEGEVDFVVIMPVAYADQCGYQVKNPDGDLVVEDNVLGQLPGNALNVVVCEPKTSATTNLGTERAPLLLHPNPTAASFRLQGFQGQESWEVHLIGLDGKRILERSGVGAEPVSVEGLPSGLYHVIVQFGQGEAQGFRLVKE